MTLAFAFQTETKHHFTNHFMVKGLEQHPFYILIKNCVRLYDRVLVNSYFNNPIRQYICMYLLLYLFPNHMLLTSAWMPRKRKKGKYVTM